AELYRVLAPGGRLLASVPAYDWAWSDHDVRAGHYRRYTRGRLTAAVRGAGFGVEQATYAFCAVFPFFAAERVARRLRERRAGRQPTGQATGLRQVHPAIEAVLLGLCRAETRVLRRAPLPFGPSVLLAARKPEP